MDTKQLEIRANNYKRLSHERSVENKRINKRIKELEKSRDSWKAKSITHKERADKLEMDLKKIKDKLGEII
jgi:chromosome segregation ATPase